jgi:tetratricopeptide (TPR) repeat protein
VDFFSPAAAHAAPAAAHAALAVAHAAPGSDDRRRGRDDDRPREVSAELAKLLTAGQRALEANDPGAALRILSSYEGEPDPLQLLLAGYAHHELEEYAKAEAAFEQAIELDDTLREARLGLARTRVMAERWAAAIDILRTFVDVDTSRAGELGLYARAAFEKGDLRLANVLVERGLIRFPTNLPLRRLDAALLLQRQAYGEAMEAALSVLAQAPSDALAWRQLAAAADQVDGPVRVTAPRGSSGGGPQSPSTSPSPGATSRGEGGRSAASGTLVDVMDAGPLALAALEAAELADPRPTQVRLRRAAALFERGALDAAAEVLNLERWSGRVPPQAVPLAVRVHLELNDRKAAVAWSEEAPGALSGVLKARVELERRLLEDGPKAAAAWAFEENVLPLLPTETLLRVARALPEPEAIRWLRYASLRTDSWGTVARAELSTR